MQAGTKLLMRILGLLAVGTILYAGAKVLAPFVANWEFQQDVLRQAAHFDVERVSTDWLCDAVFRAAQRHNIPLEWGDIVVEADSSAPRVTADYTVTADLHFFQIPIHFHVRFPAPKEAFPFPHRVLLSALGLILGFYWFFEGFVLYWKYRLIADTPLMPVRSVAMGLVQIRGKAVGEKTLVSPVSNQPCFLYKVDIDRWVSGRGGGGRWSPYLTDEVGGRFYLEDETGRVLVDPRGTEYDLDETFQTEIGQGDGLPLGQPWRTEESPPPRPGLPASDSDLRSFVWQVAHGVDTELFRGADWPAGGFKKSKRKKTRRGLKDTFRTLADVAVAAELGPLGDSSIHAPGDYRLTEYCILPEATYDLTGTCAENPDSPEGPDRQIIQKGENAATFLISNRSGKTLEGDLRAQARRYIVGGGLLAIASAAALLEAFDLLV